MDFLSSSGLSNLQAQIKIGGDSGAINPLALLELESTSKGLLIPRMTSEQRDLAFDLKKAPNGILIFNTTLQALQLLHQDRGATAKEKDQYWATYRLNYSQLGRTPQNPEVGELYYDAEKNSLQVYNGKEWVNLLFQTETQDPKALIKALEIINAVYAEILEDSSSPGGAQNTNAKAVTLEDLKLVFEQVPDSFEKQYQEAIQAYTNFKNPPTRTQVQALIEEVNSQN